MSDRPATVSYYGIVANYFNDFPFWKYFLLVGGGNLAVIGMRATGQLPGAPSVWPHGAIVAACCVVSVYDYSPE